MLETLRPICYTTVEYTAFIFSKQDHGAKSSGCGAAWLARLPWAQEAGGSNPSIPTMLNINPVNLDR